MVIGAEHEARVDGDDVEPVGRHPPRLGLGLVLGVDVGDAEAPGGERLVLVGGAAGTRRADRADRRRHDHALDSGAQRLLADDPGAGDVDLEDALDVGGPHRGRPRDVEDPVDVLERTAHRAALGDVSGAALELDLAEMVEARALAGEQPQVVPALGERGHDVRADEPAAARDQGLRHCLLIVPR